MANALVSLLGESVQNGVKDDVPVSTISGEGKVIGLYFSAHWCPPCRGFTPKLAEFYKKFKTTSRGSQMEIVFVSSDRSQSDFDVYFKEMPWLALPFENRDLKNSLSSRFNVRGIPTLIILDSATGEVITADGRKVVTADPEGENFPWKSNTGN